MRKKRMWNKTVKGSYSCMENAREIIKKTQQLFLRERAQIDIIIQLKDDCPKSGNCLIKNVIYLNVQSNNRATSIYRTC